MYLLANSNPLFYISALAPADYLPIPDAPRGSVHTTARYIRINIISVHWCGCLREGLEMKQLENLAVWRGQ